MLIYVHIYLYVYIYMYMYMYIYIYIYIYIDTEREGESDREFRVQGWVFRIWSVGFRVQGFSRGAPPGRCTSSLAETSRFKKNCFTEIRSGSEEGSYFRLIDCCITQL